MIRAGFLSTEDRSNLIALARDGLAAHRLARRANALVLLDKGWNCQEVAGALLLDDDTIRAWHNLFVGLPLGGRGDRAAVHGRGPVPARGPPRGRSRPAPRGAPGRCRRDPGSGARCA